LSKPQFVIIGAGPAGLAAGYQAVKQGADCTVLETEAEVGGLSKTIFYKGYGFDIGGHRFFTKLPEVQALWNEVLPEDFLHRPRLSRIYYNDRFFRYPLRLGDAMFGLRWYQGAEVLFSFLKAWLTPTTKVDSFEDWVSNRFGKSLYNIFFKTYTEKVWGVPCTQISADWAAQRIKSLSPARAALNALGIARSRDSATLSHTFHYPRLGPGQLYQQMGKAIDGSGSTILTEHNTVSFRHESGRILAAICDTPSGQVEVQGENFISSMPIDDLIRALSPEPPKEVLDAADGLSYRAIMTANLIVDRDQICPDNWIYLHSPQIRAGRMQVFKNWSPELVPEAGRSSVGLEYFASRGDALWNLPDADMMKVAVQDMERLEMIRGAEVVDGCIVRYDRAYPIYDLDYAAKLRTIRKYLGTFKNLTCAGRAGQFRYNNMDHSIYTGQLAVQKLSGLPVDPWDVNEDPDYIEDA